jgi:hypothetical protein
MRLTNVVFAILLGLASASAADQRPADQASADRQPAGNAGLNFSIDSQAILPTADSNPAMGRDGKDNGNLCYRMRTYRVRADLDRGSVIPVPNEAGFDPDRMIVGYSTCQQAGKFAVKSTR